MKESSLIKVTKNMITIYVDVPTSCETGEGKVDIASAS
jgi:hypothetical protein